MLKQVILISAFLIVLSSFASADEYHWACLSYGDTLLPNYACHSDCCILCVKDGYSRPFYKCYDTQMCNCGVNSSVDQDPPKVTINAPEDDYYSGSRAVEFDLTIDEPNTLYYFDSENERSGWRRICAGDWCMNYNRKISFGDGCRTVIFRAIDRNHNEGYAQVYFCVDSQKPRISRTYPNRNEYISSVFTVEYDEELLQEVTLHYKGESTDWVHVPLPDCLPGKRQTCSIELNDLPEGILTYYFSVADFATVINSSQVTVYVDTTIPTLTINGQLGTQQEPTYSDTRVPFDILITEPVTLAPVTLGYIDLEDPRPRFKRLCSKCDSYDRPVTFKDGFHRVIINASDEAGNSDAKQVEFYVDSIDPRIRGTEPAKGKYGSGLFTVNYQEDNLVEVILHYKQSDPKQVSNLNCPSGTNEYCSIYVESLNDGPLSYYFTLEDIASTIVFSKEYDILIDNTPPVLTVNNPQDGVYTTTRVPFDLIVTENVILGYTDLEDSRPRFKRLCTKCDDYNRSVTFRDGFHKVVINASDEAGNSDAHTVEFFVDSKDPRIKRIEPAKGKYGRGNFTVQYQEDALVNVTLYYNQTGSDTFEQKSTTECPSGTNEYCSIYVPGLNNGSLSYYFSLEDIATTIVFSKEYEIIIDTIIPVFTMTSPVNGTEYYRRALFNITLDEKVTLEYIDYESTRPRYTRLCSNCDSYVRERPFSLGNHNLTIRATDVAGNIYEEDVNFTIT